jgi:hypothetical protein
MANPKLDPLTAQNCAVRFSRRNFVPAPGRLALARQRTRITRTVLPERLATASSCQDGTGSALTGRVLVEQAPGTPLTSFQKQEPTIGRPVAEQLGRFTAGKWVAVVAEHLDWVQRRGFHHGNSPCIGVRKAKYLPHRIYIGLGEGPFSRLCKNDRF